MTKAGAGGTGEQLSPPLFLGILVHLIRITAFGILGGWWWRLTASLCRGESWNPDTGPSGLFWGQRPG